MDKLLWKVFIYFSLFHFLSIVQKIHFTHSKDKQGKLFFARKKVYKEELFVCSYLIVTFPLQSLAEFYGSEHCSLSFFLRNG